jgi:trans-aconitate methyltransferase
MREWNAEAYHQVSTPQFDWGVRVLDRLPLSGGERVLDVGCGSGRLTEKLAERLSDGHVIAVDVSRNMLARAREHLMPRFAGRVSLLLADAAALPVGGWADAVFSTATFHWVLDHPRLCSSLFHTLMPGGRLVAQCGGGPNIARLHRRADALMGELPFSPFFGNWREPWEFADAETTAARLSAAGFVDVVTSLEPMPAAIPGVEAFTAFLDTVTCHPYLACLPEGPLRNAFLARLAEQAAADDPPFELDYCRLNISARRP